VNSFEIESATGHRKFANCVNNHDQLAAQAFIILILWGDTAMQSTGSLSGLTSARLDM